MKIASRARVLALLATVAAVALAGCGAPESTPPPVRADVVGDAAATPVPDDVLAAARNEGPVLVYGNANDVQMQPILEGFRALHPGIRVDYLSLGGPSTFQRYLSESATGTKTADLIVDNNGLLWGDFVRRGEVQDYRDPNLATLPPFADLGSGVAAMSTDPVVTVFNKQLLPEDRQPTSLAALADMAGELDGKIGILEIENSLSGYPSVYAYTREEQEAGWDVLARLAPAATPEASAGDVVTKLTQGAQVVAVNVSGGIRANTARQYSELLNFRYLTDNTPLIPRGIALTRASSAPNAAKVFLNYVLSAQGQAESCVGGFTPYRDDVDCEFGLSTIREVVGADNLLIGDYSEEFRSSAAAVTERWNGLFRE